jgi:hypothetical protein
MVHQQGARIGDAHPSQQGGSCLNRRPLQRFVSQRSRHAVRSHAICKRPARARRRRHRSRLGRRRARTVRTPHDHAEGATQRPPSVLETRCSVAESNLQPPEPEGTFACSRHRVHAALGSGMVSAMRSISRCSMVSRLANGPSTGLSSPLTADQPIRATSAAPGHFCVYLAKVRRKTLHEPPWQHRHPILLTLAISHQQLATLEVELLYAQPRTLRRRGAEPRGHFRGDPLGQRIEEGHARSRLRYGRLPVAG